MTSKLLLDTNVWLDYYLDRSIRHDAARRLVFAAIETDTQLMAAISSLKDLYYLVVMELKRMHRSEFGDASQDAAAAIQEVAWSCIASLRKLAYVVPTDESDMIEAMLMRDRHSDFEDNLIVAAAVRSQADCVVTSDAQLLAHQPVRCLSIENAIGLVRSEGA